MQEILLGMAIFTGILSLLALATLLLRARLIPERGVTITVNQQQNIETRAGRKLHGVLADHDILLPSACGGRGSCGQCRVVILGAGGHALPTETALLSKRDVLAGVRLACQLELISNISVEVPEAVFGARKWLCRVRSNRNVSTFIKELVLELPPGEVIEFRAGGYIQLECPPYELGFESFQIEEPYLAEWQHFGLFKLQSKVLEPTVRAYSMANPPACNDIILLNVRIATPPPSVAGDVPPGAMSSYLFGLKPGQSILASGPYGEFYARETDAEMVFVGGGAGMAPMRSHILDQLERIQSQRKISFWYGARSLREAFYVEEFDALAAKHANFSWHLALSDPQPDDAWQGLTGFIHQVLYSHYLSSHSMPEECEYYLCGPPMMISASKKMLYDLGVEDESVFFDDFGS